MELLVSKDINRYEAEKELFNNIPKFLDRTEELDMRVLVTSWPRSGNSQFRKYLESMYGIYTGSATPLSGYLCAILQLQGFLGESIRDNRILFEKTHYPGRCNAVVLKANKVIVLVRNPIDVLLSHYNYIQTSSHALSIKEDFHIVNEAHWKDFVKREIKIQRDFMQFWIDKAEKREVAVHFVRFEDINKDPAKVLEGAFQFVLGLPTLEGTVI